MGPCVLSRWQIHFKYKRHSYTLGTEAEQVPGKYILQLKGGSLEIKSSTCFVTEIKTMGLRWSSRQGKGVSSVGSAFPVTDQDCHLSGHLIIDQKLVRASRGNLLIPFLAVCNSQCFLIIPFRLQLPCNSAGQKCGPKRERSMLLSASHCTVLFSFFFCSTVLEVSVTEKFFPGRIIWF